MEINLIVAIILLIVFIVVLPSIAIFVFINNARILKILSIISFVLFLICLGFLVFGNVSFKNGNIVLTLQTNNKWFSMIFLWGSFSVTNILLNIFMLFPVGAFCLCNFKKHTFIKTLLISFVISVTIELLQFVLPVNRSTEILDVILNTLSGAIGYLYFYLVFKFSNNYKANLLK